MSRELPAIPAAHGLPDCVQLCDPVPHGDHQWRLLCGTGSHNNPVYLQAVDDPATWRAVPWDDYENAIRSTGQFTFNKPIAPTGPNEVTLFVGNGFVRASCASVIEHLLRTKEV